MVVVMTEALDFLNRLRRGPVTQREATIRYSPYMLPQIKRELAGQGHLIATLYSASGTYYELLRDGDQQQRLEGAA